MTYIAGIDEVETLRVVRNAMAGQTSLLKKYCSVLSLYMKANDVAMEEVDRLRRDRSYWKRLASAGIPYRTYARVVHHGPQEFADTVCALYENINAKGLARGFKLPRYEDEDIDRRLAMIERMLFKVHMFLGALQEGASYLKRIYLSCVKLDRATSLEVTPSSSLERHNELGSAMSVRELATWLSMRKDLLRSVWSLAVAGERMKLGRVNPLSREVQECLGSLSNSLLQQDTFDDAFRDAMIKCSQLSLCHPYHLSHRDTRRPTVLRRYWLHYVGVGLCTGYAVNVLVGKHRNGDLARMTKWLREWVISTFNVHIREPFELIRQELFQTLNKKAGIVSEADLIQSNKTLDRMLQDFKRTHNQGVLDSFGFGTITASAPPSAPTTTPSGAMDEVSYSALPEQEQERVMTDLMEEYENELKNPVRGIMFGSLMKAMLIQMQKLKVHTEAAYLSMDQVIASNNLTMAISAAFPAVALTGLVYYGTRQSLWWSGILDFEGQRQAEEMLRLKMVDMDRALLDAYAPSISEMDQAAPSAAISAPTPSGPSSPNHYNSRMSYFSKNVVPMTRDRLSSGGSGGSIDVSTGSGPNPPTMPHNSVGVSRAPFFDEPELEAGEDSGTANIMPFSQRRTLQRTPSYSLSSSGRLSPENILVGGEETDDDVAGLASYETSLGSKGRLAYELRNFHEALRNLFRTKMPWSWTLLKQNLFQTDMGKGKLLTTSTDVSVYNTKWENEFVGLERDILDLSSPDFEIGGRRKISTAARMRASYACLKAPGGQPSAFF